MGELREWVELLLIPVLIPVFYGLRKAWRQWRRKREAAKQLARREARRADTYREEGIAAIDTLERELDEMQLELEASNEREAMKDRTIENLSTSVTKLAEAYRTLSNKKAVEL